MADRREAALDALLEYLNDSCPGVFKLTGRRVIYWDQLTGRTPALFVRHTGDDDAWHGEGLQLTTVEADVRIFTACGANPEAVPDTALNDLVTCVRNALAPDPVTNDYQTLGGLAYYARIEGKSVYWPGDVDQMAEATIPVRILLP